MMAGDLVQNGFAAHRAGELDRAAELYRSALAIEPRNFDALYLLGFVHLQRGQWAESERLFAVALLVNPGSVDAIFNHGRALERLGRSTEALDCFERVLAVRPEVPEVLFHRGNLLLEQNRVQEAVTNFDRALAVKPDFPEAWNNRGNALAALGRLGDALVSYEHVLAARPNDIGALNHRALTHFELKHYEEAARDFGAVLAIDPDFPYARGNRFYCTLNACDWTNFDSERAEIAAKLRQDRPVVVPIHVVAFSPSLEDQLRAARIWAADKYPAAPAVWRGETYRHDKIRVAYLSADFHSHATAALMAGVFENRDSARFHTTAISFGPDDRSEMRRRLLSAFDRFVDVRGWTDADVAKLIREMEIDIAVDLKGYTQDSRPGILAHRPAPIQAHYLGFPGTMGTAYMDYVIADSMVIPPEHEPWYSERIVRLPDTYQCNDSKRRIAEHTPTRTEAGLPEQGFVFCCFNNNFKIQPEVFDVWMRLLAAIEGSVLWLIEDNVAAARNLTREASARGIAAERLIFAPRVDLEVHLARHRVADLFLDTLPYNAHTTASDALWAGLPVLTRIGQTFAGRVAASLLSAIDLPELVVSSLQDYEAAALRLARNPTELAALRDKLRANRETNSLFDTVRFTRNLESAYERMWNRQQDGAPPVSFDVGSGGR
jgi:predicted O-linked N-acetylglucosamine transferase (SPINDLY family)